MPDLVFEIGCEELPARDAASGLRQLAEAGRRELGELRLPFRSLATFGTPRRLVLHVVGLAERQAERRTWVRGPAARAAFAPDGTPTAAAEGFARARGVRVEDLVLRETPDGRYVFAEVVEPGRPALEVLGECLAALAEGLAFPRTMRWGSGDWRFSRPVRWLLALLDDRVVPVACFGLTAGRRTYGHRTLAPGPFEVADVEDYFRTLESAFVVLDPKERRQLVVAGADALSASLGGAPREAGPAGPDPGGRPTPPGARPKARLSPELLEEVVHLVEFPTPFLGRFDPTFLALPEAVLETVMRVHQRYFPVAGPDGRLAPAFVGVRNGGREGLEEVVRGNERVLAARFADARFFYDEDRKRPLCERLPELAQIAYVEGLGTLAERTRRIAACADEVARALGLGDDDRRCALRAAELAKADLTTHLVYEFPELQGTMGAHYAEAAGEPAAVARAIEEQYLPDPTGARMPKTRPGTCLAIADKLDALASGFVAGLRPTGSQDPFGLRREAIGLVRLLRREPPGVDLASLVAAAVRRALADWSGPPRQEEEVAEDVLGFLAGRLRQQMLDEGLRHDVVEAALALGLRDVAECAWRAEALRALLARPDLDDIVIAFRRAPHQAARRGEEGEAGGERLSAEGAAEAAPVEAVRAAGGRAEAAVAARDARAFFDAVASLRPAVDRFLDDVLVMDRDPAVRRRRLRLLAEVARIGRLAGDIGRLALSGEA
ncbi:MAG: glycine--tRNA ligase subunit beta, partial [Clostridia bacterium]|nr:glycine--tRNA ligase subunit beta [Clostridia bacterium]